MRLFSDISAGIGDPWLARAYALAERGRGTAAPNPMVGCVLVRGGEVVGEGYHERAGEPHAEAVALAQAGDAARGATAYVTLEPCNHRGRTPPCSQALIAAGVAEVVAGMRDPNTQVAGGGAAVLERAGVPVRFAEDPTPFEDLNEAWLKWVLGGIPWLDVKVALTLDGRPALERGKRTTLSGPEAGALTMRLRASADAVMVGAATQQTDDCTLTVRDEHGLPHANQPLRVVLCRRGCPSPEARIFDAENGRSLVLVPEEHPGGCDGFEDAGVECATYPEAAGLTGALAVLGERGVNRVLLESGPGLFTAAWEAEAIDRLVAYHVGGVAGPGAPSLFLGQGCEAEGRLVTGMRCVEAASVGSDAVTVWERTGAARARV